MHKKALTIAIAGALAVPMAAQAIDVEISGRVSRALFITDSDGDSSTDAEVQNNGSSGSRIRVKGTGEMMDGGSAGVLLEYAAEGSLNLRYADIWFSGGYGKVSIGQGDQGGEGSVYKGGAAVLGTGHGQDHNGVATGYYTSLDGGDGRNERLRYDTPSVGPFSAAVSIGNGDQVSAGISLSQEFGGATFNAGVGTIQWGDGTDKSTISGSAGVKLASGIAFSGAWGRGKNHAGAMTMAVAEVPNTPAMDAVYMPVFTSSAVNNTDTPIWRVQGTKDGDDIVVFVQDASAPSLGTATIDFVTGEALGDGAYTTGAVATNDAPVTFTAEVTRLQGLMETGEEDGASAAQREAGMEAADDLAALFELFACEPAGDAEERGNAKPTTPACNDRLYSAAMDALDDGMAAIPAMPTTVDPSFVQVAVSYAFGDTSVGASWYRSSDMMREGSELTAIGVGVDHSLPKLNTNVYAAAQNYSIEDGMYKDTDDTVVMIGAVVKF